jgi:hypothetical protein
MSRRVEPHCLSRLPCRHRYRVCILSHLHSAIDLKPHLTNHLSRSNPRLTDDQLSALCTSECESTLISARSNVAQSCTGPNDMIPLFSDNLEPGEWLLALLKPDHILLTATQSPTWSTTSFTLMLYRAAKTRKYALSCSMSH